MRILKKSGLDQRSLLSILFVSVIFLSLSCKNEKTESPSFIEENVQFAARQVSRQIEGINQSGKVLNPRTIHEGKIRYINMHDWTSGFFPGTLWHLYDLTGEEKWKQEAVRFTESLDSVQYFTRHHDIGFMIMCSYGKGMRLGDMKEYKEIIVQSAKSLTTRFRPNAGVIQSWNVESGWQGERGWECPVIIDNMMNLELLFEATRLTGDSSWYNIAVSHADATLEHHYREDFSSYHVVDFDIQQGHVRSKETAQGYADESAWARGQSWGIYGFTVCYRETGDSRYLDLAEKAVNFVLSHPNLPEDKIPYWDFNAPKIPDEPRDASSAAILASALYELYDFTAKEEYKTSADKILTSLGSDSYRAKAGQNGNFILKHSVGSIPHGGEIDVPLNYADYYFLEALSRKKAIESRNADIVVYGGTSAGVAAAIEAVRMGKSVVLIEPGGRLGGLTTGGLGQTDIGNKQVIGGISREFYQNIKKYYENDKNWKWQKRSEYKDGGQTRTHEGEDAMWTFEPSAALKVYQEMLDGLDIQIVCNERLERSSGVYSEKGKIVSITMESGKTFHGKVFIDASYEGDLMASSGVSYKTGREANAQYGETLNGVQANVKAVTLRGDTSRNLANHNFVDGVDPYVVKGDPSSGLLPYLNPTVEPDGTGDHHIQAYCFRMCLTDNPENRIPFEKPADYKEINYELLFRNFEAGYNRVPWINSQMPNRKTDTNNRDGFSTDFIGQNYDYPEAGYAEREEIRRKHLSYQKGLMWSLAYHPRIPEHIRSEVSRWGTCKDEFESEDGWQQQLYVREARRMISDLVMTQKHCESLEIVDDAVGMAAYGMDSHNTQRFVTEEGFASNEGNVEAKVKSPYPISYRAIVPKKTECSNLVVPVCVSSTHIAFGSIRMEPVFMVLGQSASIIASMAIDKNLPVQEIPYKELRGKLLEKKQILE